MTEKAKQSWIRKRGTARLESILQERPYLLEHLVISMTRRQSLLCLRMNCAQSWVRCDYEYVCLRESSKRQKLFY
jgi:hypothetical protein